MYGDDGYDDLAPERRAWGWRPVLSEALWIIGTGAFIAVCVGAGLIARYW